MSRKIKKILTEVIWRIFPSSRCFIHNSSKSIFLSFWWYYYEIFFRHNTYLLYFNVLKLANPEFQDLILDFFNCFLLNEGWTFLLNEIELKWVDILGCILWCNCLTSPLGTFYTSYEELPQSGPSAIIPLSYCPLTEVAGRVGRHTIWTLNTLDEDIAPQLRSVQ